MSHLQAMIRTIFIYKVIVPILASQRLTCFCRYMLFTVLQLKVV